MAANPFSDDTVVEKTGAWSAIHSGTVHTDARGNLLIVGAGSVSQQNLRTIELAGRPLPRQATPGYRVAWTVDPSMTVPHGGAGRAAEKRTGN